MDERAGGDEAFDRQHEQTALGAPARVGHALALRLKAALTGAENRGSAGAPVTGSGCAAAARRSASRAIRGHLGVDLRMRRCSFVGYARFPIPRDQSQRPVERGFFRQTRLNR